jgi:putative ABC transport system permease protein
VAGITRRAVGSASVMHLAEANRLLREQHAVTGAMLSVDPGLTDEVEAALADMVNLASVVSRRSEKAYLEENLGYMYYSIGILLVFSSILGFAIVYNASLMSFAERRRELASLRVLGFSVGEVSEFLLKENLPLLALGVLAGLPAGRLLAEGYAAAVSSDLFSFEVVLYGRTYLLAALGGVLFVAVAWRLAARAVRKLEFVDVLKARD